MVRPVQPLSAQGLGVSRAAFSGFDVPATGRGRCPFPHHAPKQRIFRTISRLTKDFWTFQVAWPVALSHPAQRPNTAPVRTIADSGWMTQARNRAGLPCRFVNAATGLNLRLP
jgi:hypothetical protein